MAKTLLNTVNEILKKVGQIHGDSAALTTLTDSGRQRAIDIAIQVVNEGIDELYSAGPKDKPKGQAESAITLVTGDRDYNLASDLVRLIWPLRDKTNNQIIVPFPSGYNAILSSDPEQDDTGLPHFAAINPVNGLLYLDRAPTTTENGNIYTYQYEKDLALTILTDTVPFENAVFRAMVPVWSQLWRRDIQNEFDNGLFRLNVGRAARLLTQERPRTDYCPR